MRNFRTAAVASATAIALAATGTTFAAADTTPTATTTLTETKAKADKQVIFVGEVKDRDSYKVETTNAEGTTVTTTKTPTDKPLNQVISDGNKGLSSGLGSSQYVNDADQPFFITDAFGKKTNPQLVPQWARIWIDSAVVAGIGALVGLIIAGFNFASYNGWIHF